MKYGYLGPPGTFSEMAVLRCTGDREAIIPCDSIREIVNDLKADKIQRGIIPLENSLEGSVNISMDLLYREEELQITGEIVIPINHCLLTHPEQELSDIEKVYSHRQAIAQCQEYLNNKLEQVQISYTNSTAAAARIVCENRGLAMIGSGRISDLYNLTVRAYNIEDYISHTRFVVIGRQGSDSNRYITGEKYKTSLINTPRVNRPGVLYEILGEFAERNINLTRIESRPTKNGLGEYLFYIDIEGHQKEGKIAEALKSIKSKSAFFNILGSYKKIERREYLKDVK